MWGLQLADLAGYILTRWQLLIGKRNLTSLDKTFLEIALEAFAAERQRHLDALTELGERFASIAADPSRAEQHEHLDPVEDYHELVRSRILPVRA